MSTYSDKAFCRAVCSENNIQIAARSVATSPDVMSPQSIIPVIAPFSTSALRACKSPCSHFDDSAHGACKAVSQVLLTGFVIKSVFTPSRFMRSSILAARCHNGTPRTAFGGASEGAGVCKDRRNLASATACVAAGSAKSADVPGNQGSTLHFHG